MEEHDNNFFVNTQSGSI
jgi:hypothetical protein